MQFRSVLVAVVLGSALVIAAFLVNRQRPAVERSQPTPALVEATGKCAECHRRETSAVAVMQAPKTSPSVVRACSFVMVTEILVGVVGAGVHVEANLHGSAMSTLRDKFVFGAPAFAPLLFANLALLAIIGLWAVRAPSEPRRGGA